MTRGSDQDEAGFTALEALIALTILATVTAAVLSLISAGLRLNERSREDLTRALHAQALLNRVGLDILLEPGRHTGSLPDGHLWRLEITPFLDSHQQSSRRPQRLYDVQVQVSGLGSGSEPLMLRTLLRGAPQ